LLCQQMSANDAIVEDSEPISKTVVASSAVTSHAVTDPVLERADEGERFQLEKLWGPRPEAHAQTRNGRQIHRPAPYPCLSGNPNVIEPYARKKKTEDGELKPKRGRTKKSSTDPFEGAEAARKKRVYSKLEIFQQRSYYHCNTFDPISFEEFDFDSEDEVDNQWRFTIADKLIDDFDDVSPSEKEFFKIWNHYIRSHPIRADRDVVESCEEFVREHGCRLASPALRDMFMLHAFNLWRHALPSFPLSRITQWLHALPQVATATAR